MAGQAPSGTLWFITNLTESLRLLAVIVAGDLSVGNAICSIFACTALKKYLYFKLHNNLIMYM